jgi:hypothetical protein
MRKGKMQRDGCEGKCGRIKCGRTDVSVKGRKGEMQTDRYEGKMRKGKMWTGKRRTDGYERVYADMTVKCG